MERSAADRINFQIHLEILKRYLQTGMNVLEIGPGPGRFTIPMAEMGAQLTLADISKTQLDLNDERIKEAGLQSNIVARHQLDIINLEIFGDNSFDLSTAFGGLISYVFDRRSNALKEMLRVTKNGGYVLFSVMSKWGSTQLLLPEVLAVLDHYDLATVAEILQSGNLHQQIKAQHRLHMYSSQELRHLIESLDCEFIEMSASGFLSYQNNLDLEGKWDDLVFWPAFLEWEIEASRQPGDLDAASHIIAVIRKP